ncbi:S1C family serine protease [Herbaspirillum seropedicae]|uniref:S1C family serine protease n=1 Tax=Herbaspirillum seropedicae TaxID=964 RepID=UPI00285443B8|nr:serine protease [Herbaspirillum seropedicae]MDR6396466.1 hypothetical protein [Herbaspirillum seropedicae]
MNKNNLARSALLISMMWLLHPVAQAQEAAMPAVEIRQPLVMPATAAARPSYLARIQRRYEQGNQPIGELQNGLFCSRKSDIYWTAKGSEALLPTGVMLARFRSELQKHGYPLPGPKEAPLFQEKPDDATPSQAEQSLQVGVIVAQVLTNLCLKGNASWTGEAYLRLEWQVFAPDQRKVIFKTVSEGVFQSRQASLEGTAPPIVAEAFSVGVRNLLADPAFALALQTPYDRAAAAANASILPPSQPSQPAAPGAGTGTGGAANKPVPGPAVSIDNLPAAQPGGEMSKVIGQLRQGVVTVLTEGRSGTGFYIGQSGWLLSNQHVVGTARSVRVRLPGGRELPAEVLRVDAARDVALLKTEPPGVRPLPLRLDEPGLGEDVYALGSPLGDTFNTTLTRGILSGVRLLNGQEFLQSDVAILPGSSGGPLLDRSGQVVGITVAGLGARGMAGMNFFIPLASAVERLNLQLQQRPPKR